jgi:NAD-dependent dihydropyrimidine dehydrogenase PreA subunit
MPFVITEKCLGETYANCVDVCPVNCIHPGQYKDQAFMVIDPNECTDCTSCFTTCPIGAIVESAEKNPEYAKINAELAPAFKNNPPLMARASNDPPKKPEHKLVNA